MDFNTKRKAKRIGKTFTFLAYAMMIMFAITAIGGVVLILYLGEDLPIVVNGSTVLLYVGVPFLLIFAFGITGQIYINKRVRYQNYIYKYRQYNYFVKTIRLILEGDKDRYKYASRLYDLVKDDALRRFLYSFVLTASYFEGEPKDMERGKTRMAEILDDFDPEKLQVEKISLL